MDNQVVRFPIRVKVLIALFLCVIVPMILIGAMTFYKVNSSLMIIDQDNAMRTAISLQSTIQKQSENLLQQDVAFAKWTAFNQALEQHDLAWIKTNVDVATSVYNDLNFLAVYDSHHRLVSQAGKLRDFESEFLNVTIQKKQQQNKGKMKKQQQHLRQGSSQSSQRQSHAQVNHTKGQIRHPSSCHGS